MTTFEILAILFVVWIYIFLLNIYATINLFGFGLILETAKEDFFIKKMSNLNGYVLSIRSKVKKNFFFNGKSYFEDRSVSKTFFCFGIASMVIPLIMYFILRITFFQIIFIISFFLFFFYVLLHKYIKKRLDKFEKDENIKIEVEKIIRRYEFKRV
ncbi:MAG: hypothetical protein WC849_01080 [Candidatus Paceibacterota bacterium]